MFDVVESIDEDECQWSITNRLLSTFLLSSSIPKHTNCLVWTKCIDCIVAPPFLSPLSYIHTLSHSPHIRTTSFYGWKLKWDPLPLEIWVAAMCSVQQNNGSIITATATSLYSIHQQRKSLRSIVFAWYCHWIARHLNYFFSISPHSSSESVFTFWMFFVSFENSMALLTFILIWWIGIVITLIQKFTHRESETEISSLQLEMHVFCRIVAAAMCSYVLIRFWFPFDFPFHFGLVDDVMMLYLLLNNCVQTLVYCNTNTHTAFNCCHRYTIYIGLTHEPWHCTIFRVSADDDDVFDFLLFILQKMK